MTDTFENATTEESEVNYLHNHQIAPGVKVQADFGNEIWSLPGEYLGELYEHLDDGRKFAVRVAGGKVAFATKIRTEA